MNNCAYVQNLHLPDVSNTNMWNDTGLSHWLHSGQEVSKAQRLSMANHSQEDKANKNRVQWALAQATDQQRTGELHQKAQEKHTTIPSWPDAADGTWWESPSGRHPTARSSCQGRASRLCSRATAWQLDTQAGEGHVVSPRLTGVITAAGLSCWCRCQHVALPDAAYPLLSLLNQSSIATSCCLAILLPTQNLVPVFCTHFRPTPTS